jgi:hypothetical protein
MTPPATKPLPTTQTRAGEAQASAQEASESGSWLKRLKVGDDVIVQYYGMGGRQTLAIKKVERVTNTQIIIGVAKFRKGNGCEIGGGYHSADLLMPTPEALAIVKETNRRRDLIIKFRAIQENKLSTDTLAAIVALIDSDEPGQQTGAAGD